MLAVIASGKPGAELGGFASNGYGEHSPGGYGLMSALVIEVVIHRDLHLVRDCPRVMAEAASFDDEPDHGLRDPFVHEAWRTLLLSIVPPIANCMSAR